MKLRYHIGRVGNHLLIQHVFSEHLLCQAPSWVRMALDSLLLKERCWLG